ncbi:polysaccharide pyruvyl transferase family protein [Photobacterium damselae]|uniref:polysaccharide pyruvyl transferase family protein n=1 Tax=Photobacterium damselae TaxID=38293 RepID=UPI000839ED7E|nr:polysaccharide pyruvyl transferase family protein [Photobacterium damselae]ODA22635.1 hypothetical protein A0J46_18395 [Photobacterium damselae subsp. damselae]
MKKITLYSPGSASYNLGDKIISDSAKKELAFLLDNSFCTELPTHTPHSFYYMRPLIKNDLKFVLGSNLLKSTFFGFKRQWDVTILKSWITGPCILVGVGWWQYGNTPNLYTKLLLKCLLSKKHTHSVRDEYTKKMLNQMGFNNVVNTSCPTMWSLTTNHCNKIPKSKSDKVIFTLTDYNRDHYYDKILIKELLNNYNDVFFWPQGVGDFEYIHEFVEYIDQIKIIPASVQAFDELLESNDIDYIGTRLHAGIRSLQKGNRTLIIAIDNRAEEKNKDFNLPIIKRNNLEKLSEIINSDILTEIKIPEEEINNWKSQF